MSYKDQLINSDKCHVYPLYEEKIRDRFKKKNFFGPSKIKVEMDQGGKPIYAGEANSCFVVGDSDLSRKLEIAKFTLVSFEAPQIRNSKIEKLKGYLAQYDKCLKSVPHGNLTFFYKKALFSRSVSYSEGRSYYAARTSSGKATTSLLDDSSIVVSRQIAGGEPISFDSRNRTWWLESHETRANAYAKMMKARGRLENVRPHDTDARRPVIALWDKPERYLGENRSTQNRLPYALDLHGFTQESALEALQLFFSIALKYQIPFVRVISGRSGDSMIGALGHYVSSHDGLSFRTYNEYEDSSWREQLKAKGHAVIRLEQGNLKMWTPGGKTPEDARLTTDTLPSSGWFSYEESPGFLMEERLKEANTRGYEDCSSLPSQAAQKAFRTAEDSDERVFVVRTDSPSDEQFIYYVGSQAWADAGFPSYVAVASPDGYVR